MQPARLGPYTIVAALGRGGMGAVYEARDEAGGATVAVKTLAAHLGDDPTLRRRFGAEIEALKSLRHPGIVRMLAYGEEAGQPYFAMELVRGRSLEQLLRAGRRFGWRETVDLAIEITRALRSAHDHGVVHRDLKPANLLFPDAPEPGVTLKLADFGIARLFGGTGQTHAGTIVGTAEYMAPEQAAGAAIDHRADLYALGLVMFAMLVGRPPFQGRQVVEVLRQQRDEPAPRLRTLVPDVPEELDALVDRLLAKDPEARPAGAQVVGRQLAILAAAAAGGTATAAAERPTVAGPTPVDLLAVTRDFSATESRPVVHLGATDRAAAAATRPTSNAAPSLPHQATEPAPDGGRARHGVGTRFTTIAELDRSAEAEALRRRAGEQRWRALGAAVLLATVAGGGYLLLRPPTADALHERIVSLTTAADADPRDARPLIERFLARHAGDPRAAAIRDLERGLDLDALERRARRRPRDGDVLGPLEREYRAAMAREEESASECLAALEAILAVRPVGGGPGTSADESALWLDLVRRQTERLAPLAARERAEDEARAAATLAEAEALAAAAAATPEQRAELLARRRDLLGGLVEIYASRPHVADAVAEARRLLESP